MKPAENIEKLIKNTQLETNADTDRVVLDDVLEALKKSKKQKSAELEPNIWRMIMKSRITKLTAAAVLLMAMLVLLFVHNGQDNALISPVVRGTATEPIELVKLSSLNVAYNKGGVRALEEQFDKANRLIRIHPEEISLKELLEQLNGT